jgi:hypothetical protein
MARITLQSWSGIISNTRRILNAMFTEIYNLIAGTGIIRTGGIIISGETPLLAEDTVWEDSRAPFTQVKRGATLKPDFDETNVGLLFPRNDDAEKIFIIMQMPHTYKLGTNIHPHIHWQQMNANNVVWKMDYKWFNLNEAVPAGFTTLTANNRVYTWTAGNLHQYDEFAFIDGSLISDVSSIFLVKVYRDDNIDAGAGGGDALAWEFDFHYQINTLGSKTEYIK